MLRPHKEDVVRSLQGRVEHIQRHAEFHPDVREALGVVREFAGMTSTAVLGHM